MKRYLAFSTQHRLDLYCLHQVALAMGRLGLMLIEHELTATCISKRVSSFQSFRLPMDHLCATAKTLMRERDHSIEPIM